MLGWWNERENTGVREQPSDPLQSKQFSLLTPVNMYKAYFCRIEKLNMLAFISMFFKHQYTLCMPV